MDSSVIVSRFKVVVNYTLSKWIQFFNGCIFVTCWMMLEICKLFSPC